MSPEGSLRARYGPWALVAGGSTGLGAEFARQLAAARLNLVLVAEAAEPLTSLAADLSARHAVEVLPVVADLAEPGMLGIIERAAGQLEIGLLICNAAHVPIGPFLGRPLEDHLRAVQVNCRAPVALIHRFAPGMVARGRGGILLMSSLAGLQGSALLATYSASKAFDLVLGEALWEELRGTGVDVLALCAGAVRTETYLASNPRPPRVGPPVMAVEPVVRHALASLPRGPRVVAGHPNRIAATLLQLLPRRWSVRLMGRSTRALYPHRAD
jgi:short-subunit dehydrogenase